MNITKNRIALESLAKLISQNSKALTINPNKTIYNNLIYSRLLAKFFTFCLLGMVLLTACKKEDDLIPSEGNANLNNTSLKAGALTYYIAPNGSDAANGDITHPFFTLNKAWTVVGAGDIVYMRGGTYRYTTQQVLRNKNGTSGNMINLWAYPGEIPVITKGTGYTYNTDYGYGCYLSGDYIYLKGLDISGFTQETPEVWSGIKMENINHCIIEQLNVHHNGHGIMLASNSNDNLILNCDSHHNSDPLSPSAYNNGDGLETPSIPYGNTNTIRGCRFYWNTDDGMDCWHNEGNLIIDNCWSFYNGYIPDTFTPTGGSDGDGNGFKLGSQVVDHSSEVLRTVTNCLTYRNRREGFGIQEAKCRITIYNSTAYLNGSFGIVLVDGYVHTVRNCIAYGNGTYQGYISAVSTVDHNTFLYNGDANTNYILADADFVTLDPTGIDGVRQSDGSLPALTFLHLATGSDLIDKGIYVGLPYNGTAPDLGAFEYTP